MPKDNIYSKIKVFFEKANIGVNDVYFDDSDNNYIFVSLKTDDPRAIIGQGGMTLSAINYLVSKMIEKEAAEITFPEIVVDVDNFRRKKIDNLRTTAHMMAERAKYFKSDIEVDPMPAYERKIVHTYLQNSKNIKTESKGEGRERRIIIKYTEE